MFLFFRRSARRAGFTMSELAVVLGVVGLLLAGLWGASRSVYRSQRVSQTAQQLTQIVEGVRTAYISTTKIKDVDIYGIAAVTKSLINAGVFPQEMVSNANVPTLVNLWGGSFSFSVSGDGASFSFSLDGVPKDACGDLLMRLGGDSRDPGLTFLAAGGTDGGVTGMNILSLPIEGVSAAGSACSGNLNALQLSYRLKG